MSEENKNKPDYSDGNIAVWKNEHQGKVFYNVVERVNEDQTRRCTVQGVAGPKTMQIEVDAESAARLFQGEDLQVELEDGGVMFLFKSDIAKVENGEYTNYYLNTASAFGMYNRDNQFIGYRFGRKDWGDNPVEFYQSYGPQGMEQHVSARDCFQLAEGYFKKGKGSVRVDGEVDIVMKDVSERTFQKKDGTQGVSLKPVIRVYEVKQDQQQGRFNSFKPHSPTPKPTGEGVDASTIAF